MFDFVQEKKRWVQVILLLIILPFAFWGVDSYRKSAASSALATVDGEKITQQDFDNMMRQKQDQMREAMGGRFDAAMFDRPEVRQSVLDNLINQRLLLVRARAAGMVVSDEQLAKMIAGIEAFQKDGKFDKQRYEAALRAQNMSIPLFESRVKQDLALRQMLDAYSQNGYGSNFAADNLIRLNEQQRVVSTAQLSLDSVLKQVKVDEAAIKDYYDKNSREFQTAERAKVEYVEFSAQSLLSQMAVDADEIKKYYEEHQAEYGTPEQRQASHILIAVQATASDADKQAARAKAEQVLQQVKQQPSRFAELAKKNSNDPGSASKGGDLGFMAQNGMMVKPFEDAVFKLKVGEVSGLVQSDFGYHIIKLAAIKPAKTLALDQVKLNIAQQLKQQKAGDKFAELAEKFSNAAYEQSDSLKPAAEIAKAPVLQSAWLNRGEAGAQPWTAKALQAVFGDEVLKNKRNSQAVEIAPNTLLAVRLLEYKPASTQPLVEVADKIRLKLQRQQASELVVKQGQEMLTKLQQGDKVAVSWKSAQTVTRREPGSLEMELARKVQQVDPAKLPAYVGAASVSGGYMLARVEAVKDVDAIDDAKRMGYLQQLRQMTGEELFLAYLADARKHASISISEIPAESGK